MQMLYLHMRLEKPEMIKGAVSYEQRYSVSSWASEEAIDNDVCYEGCNYDCDQEECVGLTQGIVTDRVLKCASNDQ